MAADEAAGHLVHLCFYYSSLFSPCVLSHQRGKSNHHRNNYSDNPPPPLFSLFCWQTHNSSRKCCCPDTEERIYPSVMLQSAGDEAGDAASRDACARPADCLHTFGHRLLSFLFHTGPLGPTVMKSWSRLERREDVCLRLWGQGCVGGPPLDCDQFRSEAVSSRVLWMVGSFVGLRLTLRLDHVIILSTSCPQQAGVVQVGVFL